MEYRSGRPLRSSLRSKTSSSTSDADPREKIKDCCRKFVAFMCTQVGVGGLVVGYTIVGAFSFQYIETRERYPLNSVVKDLNNITVQNIWNTSYLCNQNVCNKTLYKIEMNRTLFEYQTKLVDVIKRGYDGRLPEQIWTIPTALMFSLSIITMIGYGNMVPRTSWGKGITVLYAVVGIPLYVLYFLNMGEVLAGTFRWVYTWLYNCSTEQDENDPPRRVIVPSTACLWVIGGYVLTGALMFSAWENWSYLNSTYFCVTSLCKIGLGDLVPGAASKSGNETKLVINYIYMLVGLGLVAMCYNLLREEISVKVGELKEDFGQCLEDTRMRFALCCRRCRTEKY